jgi:hypothetical protein
MVRVAGQESHISRRGPCTDHAECQLPQIAWRCGRNGNIMLIAGNWCGEHLPPPRTYLWGLRFHKNRNVIRPNNGWTAFISSWIIE